MAVDDEATIRELKQKVSDIEALLERMTASRKDGSFGTEDRPLEEIFLKNDRLSGVARLTVDTSTNPPTLRLKRVR